MAPSAPNVAGDAPDSDSFPRLGQSAELSTCAMCLPLPTCRPVLTSQAELEVTLVSDSFHSKRKLPSGSTYPKASTQPSQRRAECRVNLRAEGCQAVPAILTPLGDPTSAYTHPLPGPDDATHHPLQQCPLNAPEASRSVDSDTL